VLSAEELLQVLLDREKLGSTGIGEGIAIPHGRLKKLRRFFVSFGRSVKGVDFDSIDGKPSQLFFLVMAP
jgi:PTS system nitrogen regulatory IIA component